VEDLGPLSRLPLGWFFVVTLLMVLASAEAGYRLGRRRRRSGVENETSLGTIVGAELGLLAFVLAFTFGLAAGRYDTRRQLLLDEANAIGTTYLRAGFLPEPRRGEIRALLRDYVDARLEWGRPGRFADSVSRSETLQGRLWAQAEVIAAQMPTSTMAALFVQALNETIDLHGNRKTMALWARIPTTIWLALFLVAILTMGTMGYHAGMTASPRSPAEIAVVLSFAIIMLLIADLDRPNEGLFRVHQGPLLDLEKSVAAP
jgi:hypothetical protein